ncbi:Brix-domain-containing protein [Rozella allomycis CSF55]|uniref:U3 small nucleolar ribonucleoprotein protein IMP4 n=1 Tax=Rozella allomycis (strain CSF55) TaxID=988480 RepID=A0A4P9YEF0_ROZAC|nr:Brix-domain-containing protein [Rozella allomycis CSF55]
MIRKQARERRDYLFRKSLEVQERQTYERKQKLKQAIQDGKYVPKSADLKDLDFDPTQEVKTHIDDEYAKAGVRDPKVLITTSRDPSSRLLQFSKEMRLVIPNSQRMNRGNYVLKDIVDACRSNEVTDLVILHEHRGVPDGMIVCHFPYGPTAYFSLHNVVLRHDLPDQGNVSEAYPHLIFDKFTSNLGQRVKNILKFLFPVPKEESKRVMTFANNQDFISFRHHVYFKTGNHVEMAEVGPRFEMRPYELKLGTIDVPDADVEWVLRPFMNTAKKRDFL